MSLSEGRLLHLNQMLAGFVQTHIPLISHNGTELVAFLGFDDIGSYIFIPCLARLLNISAHAAAALFFYGLFCGAFILATVAFFLLYRTWLVRFLVVIELFMLLLFSLRCLATDVYSMYLVAQLGTIPWFLYYRTKHFLRYDAYCFLFIAGISMGCLHYVRAYSSLSVVIFVTSLLVTAGTVSYIKKLLLMGCMLLGIVIPGIYVHTLMHTYRTYLKEHSIQFSELVPRHPVWHPMYLGFGFLNFGNTNKIKWSDRCGELTVRRRAPDVSLHQFDEYEAILRDETINLIKEQPQFVMFTLFAKLGILLLYLIIFCNIGLLCAYMKRKEWDVECAFLSSFAITALFPLITIPISSYSLGFISCATLYSIVSIGGLLEE